MPVSEVGPRLRRWCRERKCAAGIRNACPNQPKLRRGNGTATAPSGGELGMIEELGSGYSEWRELPAPDSNSGSKMLPPPMIGRSRGPLDQR